MMTYTAYDPKKLEQWCADTKNSEMCLFYLGNTDKIVGFGYLAGNSHAPNVFSLGKYG